MLKKMRSALLLSFLLVIVSCPALGGGRDIDIRLFEPAPDEFGGFSVLGTSVLKSFQPLFGFSSDFARNPLIIVAGRTQKREVVSAALSADLFASIGLFDQVQVSLTLPVAVYTGGDGIQPGDDFSLGGLGDTRLLVKWRIVDREENPVGFGFVNAVAFPSAVPRDSFQGGADNGVMYEPRLTLDSSLGPALLVANLGYRTRPTSKILGLRVGDEWFYSGAAIFRVMEGVDVMGELFGSTTAHAPFGSREANHALEGVLGGRYTPRKGLSFRFGMGFGALPGYGCPKYRVVLGMSWTPYEKPARSVPPQTREKIVVIEKKIEKPAPPPPKKVQPVAKKVKAADSDSDGLPDDVDKCPNDSEDKDGFEDDDGCPDKDNDQDGVLDADDKCPNDSEDKDGFEDDDGCPDKDNDRDGVLDADDKCPNEPETINGVKDSDGCPDKGAVKVIVTKERIEIKEKIYFATNRAKIRRRSYSILNQVAQVLKAHPEIKRVRIEGHTDNSGKRSWNLKLSKWRATEVMKYLIRKGVSPDRLEAVGFGPDKPIATNRTRRGRAANRRVEFRILETEPAQMEIPALVPVPPQEENKKH